MLSYAFPLVPTFTPTKENTVETIHNLDDETIKGLRKLCKLNNDSAEGFKAAAEQLNNADMERAFQATAMERRQQRDEIATFIGMNHEKIPEQGTALGTAHRWWLEARSALNGNNDAVVLTEAARGEKAIEDEYVNVLQETAGSPTNELLHRHIKDIKQTRNVIEGLKSVVS